MINLARRLLRGALAFRAQLVRAISGKSTGTQNDGANAVAVDSAGNLLLAGTTATTVAGWVAKFDAAGTLAWQRKQSLAAAWVTLRVAVDGSDNVYAGGRGYVSEVPYLPMLFKYNSAGALQWQRQLTSADSSLLAGLCTSAAGDSYVLLSAQPATPYTVLAKYSSAGALQWQRNLSSTYTTSATLMAFAADGGLVLAGIFYDGANAVANSRGIIAKYDTSGAIQWQYKFHWSATQVNVGGLAVDAATGDIYVTGGYLVSGTLAAFIAKFNSAGTHQWSRRHPTASTSLGAATVDAATGAVYAAGNSPTPSITCWDASGTLLWERTIAGDGSAQVSVTALAVSGPELLACLQAAKTGNGLDAVLLRMPLTGGAATTCGYLVLTEPTASVYTTPSAPTVAAAGLTDAAASHTDAAGTATEAAGVMTFTNYTN